MEPFDESFTRLDALIADIGSYGDTLQTEQDVRLKVIDPVFNRVLGWPLHAISTEDPAGDGFIDYKLTVDGFARLIVEAKRDSRSFELKGRAPGRSFKLNGAAFTADAAQQGIAQAIY
ncbi:MAG TPA: hypothetical protein VLA19_26000 [Herpetosiphonaceae bacterium]|nr:hypothetical protein [Herpetosiphonaceae bacterium]